MKILTPLLFPFAVLYDVATSIRNRLYDSGVRPSATFDVPVVGVGNLSVGGTGKTPMVEYLIRLFADEFRVATLSRGYGRKTHGVRIAGEGDHAETIGDEPFQFYTKFRDQAVVAVGEERAYAIPQILDQYPDTDLIILDDAFQHRRVQPSFQILLTDYHHLFVSDFVLPAGRLRESKRGASRADVIVVTKCPAGIPDEEKIAIESAIRRYTSKAVFFTSVAYGNLLSVTPDSPDKPEKIVLVTGIANAAPMEDYLRKNYNIVRHFDFSDHHKYSEGDIFRICEAARNEGAAVVTTEKDLARLTLDIFDRSSVSLHYLPIEIEFLKNGKEFDEMVLNAVRTYRVRRSAGDSGDVST